VDSKANEQNATAAQWQQQLAAMKARMAAAGIVTPAQLASRSGIEMLQAIGMGALPSVPIGHTLDFWPVEAEPGRVVFQGQPAFGHLNPMGAVHGGWIATLLDSALGCSVHSMLPAGKGYTTLELKVNFIRAVTQATGPLRAEGKVVHVGGRTGIAEARLVDAGGRLYAHATTTCLVFDLPPAAAVSR
jgi:uncharacterized protein (TIGR00369 family)